MSKIKNWDWKIKELEIKGVIIDMDEADYGWYFNRYGIGRIIDPFEHEFIFPYNRTRFCDGTHLSSFINLFEFNDRLSKILFGKISDIEIRLENALFSSIASHFQKDVPEKTENFWLKDFCFNEIENNPLITKSFIRLFKQHNFGERRRINKLITYLIENKHLLFVKKFGELLESYYQNYKNDPPFKNLNQIFNIKTTNVFVCEIKPLNDIIYNEKERFDKFNILYNNFILYDIKRSMLKNYHNIKQGEIQISPNEMPISRLAQSWTFGRKSKIFESLDSRVKIKVIDHFFNGNPVKWHHNSKANSFIGVIETLIKMRNSIAHNEVIYNFEITKSIICTRVSDFISLNRQNLRNSITQNNINLFLVFQCLEIFDENKIGSVRNEIYTLWVKFIYSNFFPEKFTTFLSEQLNIK